MATRTWGSHHHHHHHHHQTHAYRATFFLSLCLSLSFSASACLYMSVSMSPRAALFPSLVFSFFLILVTVPPSRCLAHPPLALGRGGGRPCARRARWLGGQRWRRAVRLFQALLPPHNLASGQIRLQKLRAVLVAVGQGVRCRARLPAQRGARPAADVCLESARACAKLWLDLAGGHAASFFAVRVWC